MRQPSRRFAFLAYWFHTAPERRLAPEQLSGDTIDSMAVRNTHSLGISPSKPSKARPVANSSALAKYVREFISNNPNPPIAKPPEMSSIFDLGASNDGADISRDKQKLLADAVESRLSTSRRTIRQSK